MYKIHKPHLDAHYLEEVRYEKTLDPEGKPDWEIYYRPGARARAQYALFNGKRAALGEAPEAAGIRKQPGLAEEAVPQGGRTVEIEALLARGVGESQTRKLLDGVPADQSVMEQIEWGDHLIQRSGRDKFRNPPGFYVHLIREKVMPPESFLAGRRAPAPSKDLCNESERRYWRRRELELSYEEYRREEAARYIAEKVTPQEFTAAVQAKKIELAGMYRSLRPEAVEEIATQMVHAEIARRLELLPLEEFCREAEARRANAG
jgi:hypothetical protein